MSSPLAGALMMTFLAPASMCAPAFVGVGEDAGRLEDDVDAEVVPRQGRRVLLREDLDLAAVDDRARRRCARRCPGRPVGRVVLEQQRVHLGVDQVVDGDDFDVRRALDDRLERLAADAAEAVDADAGRHGPYLLIRTRRRTGRSIDDRVGRAQRAMGAADPRVSIVRRQGPAEGCDRVRARAGRASAADGAGSGAARPPGHARPPPSPAGVDAASRSGVSRRCGRPCRRTRGTCPAWPACRSSS